MTRRASLLGTLLLLQMGVTACTSTVSGGGSTTQASPPRIVVSGEQNRAPALTTWFEIPEAYRQLMEPPRSAVADCIARAKARGEVTSTVALAECMDVRLSTATEVFLGCHQLAVSEPAHLYFERRRSCLIGLGAKRGA